MSSVIIKTFQELDKEELYKFIQLRIEVFVVEQDCPYQDLDDLRSQKDWTKEVKHSKSWSIAPLKT